MEPLIKRNATIPCEGEKYFPTTRSNQTEFEVTLLEGEERKAQENNVLLQLVLSGLP